MDNLFFPFKRFWRYLKGSIIFVPTVWVIAAIIVAALFRYLENLGLSQWLGEASDYWIVADPASARTILSTVIGGTISLTVFSFSMVMVVLGQATNSLSPRLLPQLIRDRSHQTVLGAYLAVIVFSCLALTVDAPNEDLTRNSFTVFCSIILMIVSLGLFVYFIASVSRRIQVGEVIRDVHQKAVYKLEQWRSGKPGWSVRALPAPVEEWFPVMATQSGYVDITIYEELSRVAGQLSTRLFLEVPRNEFSHRGEVLFRSERPLENEERTLAIASINLNIERDGELHYRTAISHIKEVAIKALSPGINDPGTALEAINLLTDLLQRMLQLPPYSLYRKQKGACGDVFFRSSSMTGTLHQIYQSIRTYAKTDPVVMTALVRSLEILQRSTKNKEVLAAISSEKDALRIDGEQLPNAYDREEFLALFP